MISDALNFICNEMNDYLILKTDLNITSNAIGLYNVSQLGNADSNNSDTQYSSYITLFNIEEDRISKSPENYIRSKNGSIVYQSPKIFLNLYLLFSANSSKYSTSLLLLSYVIQFFQYQNVFTPLTNPPLSGGADKLIFDLYTLSFQDLNNLWGIMGSKYLPSVMYKMRLITIDEDSINAEGRVITSITVNSRQ